MGFHQELHTILNGDESAQQAGKYLRNIRRSFLADMSAQTWGTRQGSGIGRPPSPRGNNGFAEQTNCKARGKVVGEVSHGQVPSLL